MAGGRQPVLAVECSSTRADRKVSITRENVQKIIVISGQDRREAPVLRQDSKPGYASMRPAPVMVIRSGHCGPVSSPARAGVGMLFRLTEKNSVKQIVTRSGVNGRMSCGGRQVLWRIRTGLKRNGVITVSSSSSETAGLLSCMNARGMTRMASAEFAASLRSPVESRRRANCMPTTITRQDIAGICSVLTAIRGLAVSGMPLSCFSRQRFTSLATRRQ
jgi:hypothetical protein